MNGRALIWIIVGVVVLGAAVTAIVLLTQSGEDAPDQGTAQRTQEFLKGEGAPLLTMHSTAQTVANGVSDCANIVAQLDKDAPPDQMVLLIGSVDDEMLQDAMTQERQALGESLTSCQEVQGLDPAVQRVQTRLDELGIRR